MRYKSFIKLVKFVQRADEEIVEIIQKIFSRNSSRTNL